MGELRERMQQDLILHGMAPRTQEAYLTAVQDIAKYYHQRPDTLSEAQLHAYLRFLLDERHLWTKDDYRVHNEAASAPY